MKDLRKIIFIWNHISDKLTKKKNRSKNYNITTKHIIKSVGLTNKHRNTSKNGNYWVTHCLSYLHLEVSLAV